MKAYGKKRAVDDLSFAVGRGELFALLGPNGAGKTTTIEVLEGYRPFDAGKVSVLGLDPLSAGSRLKSKIGVMLQEGGLYPTIRPREALHLFAHFYSNPLKPDALLELVGLEDVADTPYRRLSGGERQRLSLALALVGRPELVFLDEPTAGLDPQARQETWSVIRELRSQDVTIMLTTHYLEEVERLADRVCIIDHGRLVALESPQVLMGRHSNKVRLTARGPLDESFFEGLHGALSFQRLRDDSYSVTSHDNASLLVAITQRAYERGVALTELRSGTRTLEEAFLDLTGRSFDS